MFLLFGSYKKGHFARFNSSSNLNNILIEFNFLDPNFLIIFIHFIVVRNFGTLHLTGFYFINVKVP